MSDYLKTLPEIADDIYLQETMEQVAELVHKLLPLGHQLLQTWNHMKYQTKAWEQAQYESQADQSSLEEMETTGPLDWSQPEPTQVPAPRFTMPNDELVHPELWQLACEGQLPLKTPNLSLGMVHLTQRFYLAKDHQS